MLKSVWLSELIVDSFKRDPSLISLSYKKVSSLIDSQESYLVLLEPWSVEKTYIVLDNNQTRVIDELPIQINTEIMLKVINEKQIKIDEKTLYLPLFLEKTLCFGMLVFKADSRIRKVDSILAAAKTFSFILYNEANSTIIDSTHKTVIKTENLCVNYSNGKTVNKALQDVNLEIKENEFTLIIGSSGSGKSTLLNAIGGMLKPTNGDIYYKDKNISKMNDNSRSDYRKDIVGFIFQQYNLLSDLTVKENIELASSLVKDSFKVEEVLKMVGLENKVNSFPNELSGGEQQRVCIARALVKKPKILLCDEPTGALDTENAKVVIKILKDISIEQKLPVVVITHNPSLVVLADRCITIKNGRIEDDIYQPFALSADYLD
ncbi:MAG: ABC transporter ATP-binding protein [Bacilli bacterium]|nr:ABC transporter ATP-binding protein [Bacilli bacterium]